ncbi:MAG: pantetheine-phosphate adenylyltransferase [Bdellovibrionales bacterium]|nr:pantetheine-phosphate adenylyltransferase [Bdellovibrionales bacterium]
MRNRVAVYPGFFDPFTMGHLNIVERIACVFDEVVISVASASPKNALFSLDDRVKMIKEAVSGHNGIYVETFDGLLMEYVKQNNYPVIVRGLRTVSDYEYEFQMAQANRTLDPQVETFFMVTAPQYSYLSSTLIKEIARLGGNISSMVPQAVLKKMEKVKQS